MEKYLEENDPIKISIDCYEKSDVILSIFFAFIDLVSILFFVLKIISQNEKVIKLKAKLFKLFIIDFILRLLYTRKYTSWTLSKEIFMTFMSTVQFYLVLSFILIAMNSEEESNLIKNCPIFFLITFSYEYIFDLSSKSNLTILLNKITLLLQSIFTLYCIYEISEAFKDKVVNIVNILKSKDDKLDKLNLFILGSPQSCYFLFYFYYILKMIFIFIKNPIFVIYANILLNIVKEASKLFSFFICIAILYQLNKMKMKIDEEQKKPNSDENIKLNKS